MPSAQPAPFGAAFTGEMAPKPKRCALFGGLLREYYAVVAREPASYCAEGEERPVNISWL